MNCLIVGATGAIGANIQRHCKISSFINNLYSPNSTDLRIGDLASSSYLNDKPVIDQLILSFGTFGGLKSYENRTLDITNANIVDELRYLIDHRLFQKSKVILYSSAALEDEYNLNQQSPYFEYCSHKEAIENVIKDRAEKYVILRPTNIMSKYENHNRSAHVIASIYRKIRDNPNSKRYQIWSHPNDWREFTGEYELSQTIENVIDPCFDGYNETYAFGSGEKVYIKDIVKEVLSIFNRSNAEIEYTQPHKRGPQLRTTSISPLISSTSEKIDIITELRSVLNYWRELDIARGFIA